MNFIDKPNNKINPSLIFSLLILFIMTVTIILVIVKSDGSSHIGIKPFGRKFSVSAIADSILSKRLMKNGQLSVQNSVSSRSVHYTNYWPMNLDNWWVYKTEAPSTCLNASGQPAKTAWWVIPPDLSWRLNYSRQLVMYKEDPCTYNWIDNDTNIRWAVTNPVKDSFGTLWWSQRGNSNFLPGRHDGGKRFLSGFNPPFNTENSHFAMDVDFTVDNEGNLTKIYPESSDDPLKPIFFLGRKRGDDTYPPYLFFPYSSSFFHTMEYATYFTCGNSSGAWEILKGSVPGKCRAGGEPGYWMVRYIENVPVTIRIKDGETETKSALKFRVFEPHPQWGSAACENWYFVENIGPVRIEASHSYMYTRSNFDKYKNYLYLSQPSNNSSELTWENYARESFVNRCLKFDFSENAVDQIIRADNIDQVVQSDMDQVLFKFSEYNLLNSADRETFLRNMDKKRYIGTYAVINLYDYQVGEQPSEYDFQDYDSPVMVAGSFLSPHTDLDDYDHMLYFRNGKYWMLNMKTGRWIAYGRVKDVWGENGSNAPKVVVNGQDTYPWSFNGPQSLSFGQNIKNMFGDPFLVVNKGAYWLWDYCSEEDRRSHPYCIGAWKQSGKFADLLSDIGTQILGTEGLSPFTDNGPTAINAAWWDPYGLELWNKGGFWYYRKEPGDGDGIWVTSLLLQNTNYGQSVNIEGEALTEPRSVTYGSIYKDNETLQDLGNPPIIKNKQKLYVQNGKYWIKYEDLDWERW